MNFMNISDKQQNGSFVATTGDRISALADIVRRKAPGGQGVLPLQAQTGPKASGLKGRFDGFGYPNPLLAIIPKTPAGTPGRNSRSVLLQLQ